MNRRLMNRRRGTINWWKMVDRRRDEYADNVVCGDQTDRQTDRQTLE